MRELMLVAGKDLRRFLRDPVALALWLGVPLLIGALFLLALGGSSGPAPRVHLLVADEDDGFLSRLLLGGMTQDRLGEMFQVEKVQRELGQQRMDRGEASALVIVPEGFTKAVLQEKPTKLVLITNPSQQIGPKIVEQLLRILADVAFYAQQLIGPELRMITEEPPEGQSLFSDAEIARQSVAINQTVRKLERYAFPPVIELETTAIKAEPDAAASGLPFLFHFVPGVLFMGLLFASQGLAGDLWQERESGMLRRVVASPLRVSRFLLGKFLASAVVLGGVSLILLAAGIAYFELPWQRLPLALAWATLAGLMLTAMMLLIQVLSTSRRGASFLGFALVMPLMLAGGSMFPFEAMPGWLAAIGRRTPNGWALQHLKAILLGSETPLELLVAIGIALAVTTALLLAASLRIERVFARR